MNNTMSYGGYEGCLQYDDEADIFHGRIIGIRDVITFEGKSIRELKKALKDSIGDYLEMCEQEHKSPDKPFSGKLTLRLGPKLHNKAVHAAAAAHKSLNTWIIDAIENNLVKQNIRK